MARARVLLVVDSLLQVRGDKFKTLYHSVLYPVRYSWTVIFRPIIMIMIMIVMMVLISGGIMTLATAGAGTPILIAGIVTTL